MCMCVCVIQGQIYHRHDQRRMSTSSCENFTTSYHRYDSDSSLDIPAHTRHDSFVPTRETFRRSLPRLSAARLHGRDRHSSGSKSHENVQGQSGSYEGYLRSSDTHEEEDRMNKGELIDCRGRNGSQDMQARRECLPKDHTVSVEDHSRSNDMVCVNCGCERSTVVTSMAVDHNMPATNHVDTQSTHSTQGIAELGRSQGSAATQKSRGDSHINTQSSAGVAVSEAGGENTASQGTVGTEASRCGGVFAVESYSGGVSRELCQQLVELLSDLNSARDLNIDVCCTAECWDFGVF